MAPRPQNQKRRPESARRANRIIQTRTLLLLGVFGVLTFVLLFTQLYRWQITEHDELQSVAVRQQTLRTTVEASRGTIYDRNGTILAMSASAEDIFISPKEIIENDQDQNLIAGGLAEILDLDPADILKKMEKTNSQYEELKKKADDELADKVREFINENDLKGVFIRPTSKRTYPKGTLASQVIGFANENGGAMGLEAAYNDELTGENGMVVTARDRDGRSVLYQYDQYFDAENGCDLHTTLDTTIQYYLEKGVQELEARFGTGKGAEGIVMDVNTGAVLAMASLPTYDLNSPGTVYNDFLTSGMTEEQVLENMRDLLNKQWRSKAINDTYEPGSTFKTLTLAMALEENVVDLNTGFYCSGSVKIEGETINCSKRAPGHGQQNLTQAFANSCNPAFINIGLRIGNDKFYQYMLDFGLTEKTGIDTWPATPSARTSTSRPSRCWRRSAPASTAATSIRPILSKRSPTRMATSSPSMTPRPSVRSSPRRRPRLCATLWSMRSQAARARTVRSRATASAARPARPIRSAAASSSRSCASPPRMTRR